MHRFAFVVWAVFLGVLCGVQAVFAENVPPSEEKAIIVELKATGGVVQPIGKTNDAYAKYFTGQSYVFNLSQDPTLPVVNVTFAHGAHTFWHIHHNTCQVLVASAGRGYYQIEGEQPKLLLPGQTVTIPANVKHWHGSAPKASFQHIVYMKQGADVRTEWLEPVSPAVFSALP